MRVIVLTKSTTPIIGWIAELLGLIMNGIFNVLDFIGIPNIGLSIILFTIVIYLLLLPLTIKQQKFSKLSAKMNPEIQAIRDKYKNKKDNESAMQMNAETQAVYAKYGVSPSGSCVQLLIQMPILFALYRVIDAMPAYVNKIGNAFGALADKVIELNLVDKVREFGEAARYAGNFDGNVRNAVIDVLNKMNSADLIDFATEHGFADLQINGTYILTQGIGDDKIRGLIDTYNNFLGLNMGNSPSYMVNQAIAAGAWLMVVAAFAIPVLSAVTQWINVKLMPQQDTGDSKSETSSLASSMKVMNMIMPVMSAFFCYNFPAGLGLYWVAGSVVRSIQQVIINRHIDKMDLSEIIEKNREKSAKKMEKIKENQKKYAEYAAMNTKKISTGSVYTEKNKAASQKAASASGAPAKSSSNAKPGSLMAKANMVKDYNERNNK